MGHRNFQIALCIHALVLVQATQLVWSQVPWCEEIAGSGGPETFVGPWPSCGTHFDYIPDATTLPKVVKVNVHYMLDANNGGNFTATGDNLGGSYNGWDYATTLFDQINAHATVNWQMHLPPGNNTAILPLKYGFQLASVYYHSNGNCFYATQIDACVSTYAVSPSSEINVFFASDPAAAPGTLPTNAGAATTSGLPRYVRIQGAWQTYAVAGGFTSAYQEARLLLHELTHCLTLRHTMMTGSGTCSASADDQCSDTPTIPDMQALGYPAPHGCCADQPLCSNNLMDYNADWALTPEQLGRIHKCLTTELLPFLVDEYCSASTAPNIIPAGPAVEWSGSKILTSDLIIEPGATLVVKCDVHVPSTKKVVVEPGGKLVVDAGLFTNLCGEFWSGIEVWGNTSENQFPTAFPEHQGMLILKNGAVIEHAREGAQNWKPDDWNSIGGVIQVQGTHDQVGATSRNCRRAVRFMKYQNFLPGHPDVRLPDHSSFSYARFEYDEDYRDNDYVYAPVTMWGTNGIVFKACSFENKQIISASPPFADLSSKLGKGIYSEDASYTVCGNCNAITPYGAPCPLGELDYSEFIGFDHGISALGTAGSSASFAVYDTHFRDNVCGVYVNGVVGYQVKGCTIDIGGRSVDLDNVEESSWEGFQRGIYSTESWAFAVEDNTVGPSGTYPFREAIVIGYNRDHNDVVFRNTVNGLEVGYVGEGIAASLAHPAWIGLNWMCNLNDGNGQNFWSRMVMSAEELERPDHTIRTNQGSSDRPADNTFDRVAGSLGVGDYEVTTVNGTITYWHRNIETPYEPAHVRQTTVPPTWLEPEVCSTVPVQDNCARKIKHQIALDPGHPSGLDAGDIQEHLTAEKLAYGNTRYLYDDLIDGGSTDEVVLEIMSAWPQDAWELRNYLLSLSPFLSVDALKVAMDKPGFPAAMKAEVCIANPEATQREGFMSWLRAECLYPLPQYMLEAIEASWDTRTYRSSLEAEMAYHHGEMTQAANMLLHRHAMDTDGAQPAELRAVWQQVRTPAARYAEALTWMDEGNLVEAADVVESIPLEHDLRAPEMLERQRMLDLIAYMEPIRFSGRNDAQLTGGEIADLEALRGDAYDRPATWISNLLCFHYSICRAPPSGGQQGDPKALRAVVAGAVASPTSAVLTLHPNPAMAWVAVEYDLLNEPTDGRAILKDVVGREVLSARLGEQRGQLVWDIRVIPPGTYSLTLLSKGVQLRTEKLIIRQ